MLGDLVLGTLDEKKEVVVTMDYLKEFVLSDHLFWFCALVGTLLFFIQFFLTLFGFSSHVGCEMDGMMDHGHDAVDVTEIKWLSMQTVTGFLMMFGWSALTCRKEFELGLFLTFLFSLLVGIFSIFVLYFLSKKARGLESPGSLFSIEEAIGKEAVVYQRIPPEGTGKVLLTLKESYYEIDAISQLEDEIPSFSRVRILEKIDENTVLVTPV